MDVECLRALDIARALCSRAVRFRRWNADLPSFLVSSRPWSWSLSRAASLRHLSFSALLRMPPLTHPLLFPFPPRPPISSSFADLPPFQPLLGPGVVHNNTHHTSSLAAPVPPQPPVHTSRSLSGCFCQHILPPSPPSSLLPPSSFVVRRSSSLVPRPSSLVHRPSSLLPPPLLLSSSRRSTPALSSAPPLCSCPSCHPNVPR